eukprot:13276503-Alexandrium_andersonii.AAC.1
MLGGARAPDAHPSACGTPSVQTPSEINARINSHLGPLRPAKEMVGAPRAHDQVTRQPDQRRPVRGGG